MIVDEIMRLKKEGRGSEEIASILMQQGNSAQEVMQGLEQANITPADNYNEMQPSMMNQTQEVEVPEAGIPGVEVPEAGVQDIEQSSQEQSPYQNYQYPEYQYQQQELATESVSEIAEQIVTEKIDEFRKKISAVNEFKILAESRIKDIDERLRKIENVLDNIQASILNRVGVYMRDVNDIKRELQMTQESFSKVLAPLTGKAKQALGENIDELKKISKEENMKAKEETSEKTTEKSGKNKGAGFESYLRR